MAQQETAGQLQLRPAGCHGHLAAPRRTHTAPRPAFRAPLVHLFSRTSSGNSLSEPSRLWRHHEPLCMKELVIREMVAVVRAQDRIVMHVNFMVSPLLIES